MKKLLFPLVLLFVNVPLFSQEDGYIPALVNEAVYEKVYLHIDRENYAPREDIWFKVYLVSGISNRLIDGYKNVYVQLVDEKGEIHDSKLILVSDGVGIGDFRLPATIGQGQYTIRAFTRYQENFGEESYYHKKIWISESKPQAELVDEHDPNAIDVGFYPEGGNLVLNSSNTIAFKAINSEGYGISVDGFVLNDMGDTITPFSSDWIGMGKFALMPSEGRSYHAVLEAYPDFKYDFPRAQVNGINLYCRDETTQIKFGAGRNFNIEGRQDLILHASHKGIELFRKEIQLNGFYGEITVPKERFPLGISKITLKNTNDRILAERLIFVKTDAPALDIETSKSSYDKRSEVNINIQSLLDGNDSLNAGVSVAVVNRNYLSRKGYQSDMQSYLLIDSELKGPVESSASFFTDSEWISSYEKLDLLMLVHGWRSYYWPDIIISEPDDLEGWEDIGITIEGRVKRHLGRKRVSNGKVVVGPFGPNMTFIESVTDRDGNFRFDRLFIPDSTRLIIQAKTAGGSNRTEILVDQIYKKDTRTSQELIDSVIYDLIVPNSYYSFNFSKLEAERKYAIESGTYWLDEVEVITGQKKSVINLTEEADRTYGSPDRRFEISPDDMNYLNIYDYLENRIPGMVVQGNSISIRGGQSPTILLDDVVNDLVEIGHIPMGDIDHIDVFMSGVNTAAFGSRGADGIIAIYTKMGSVNSDFHRYVKGRYSEVVDGFQRPRRFYSPKYNMHNINSEVPDFRPTLYWNPIVDFQDDHASVSFFTSDFVSKYLVIVEGISDQGEICTGIGEFDVK
ncbi:MAG: hypothetical protein K9J30_10520 [Bacteroidales bacterium]|nr:hypothetical protein [Bacteroidales bacterium]